MTKINKTLAPRCKKILGLIVAGMLLFGGATQAQVNMNRYIKLNVVKDSVITLNWTTDIANTPVKIVSGDSVYNFTTTTGWIGDKSCYAADDTMYVYGNVKYFSCSNNAKKITGVDISNNLGLTNFQCSGDSLSAIDVSKNTALTYLACGSNQLTSLDVSKNTALITLLCYNNQLTSLDVSKNTALKLLNCNSNQLTSLDVSKNVALCTLYCYRNPFTTAEYDAIMCSLPIVSSGTGSFLPLYNSSDTNATKFAASNSLNAKAKNWNVQYNSGGGAEIPATTGTYKCPFMGNSNRYIKLNVAKNSVITLNWTTDSANTPVKIVSGDSVYEFTTTSTGWIGDKSCYAADDTMYVYGNVKYFSCQRNAKKIIGVDISNNLGLTSLQCDGDSIRAIDVSQNTALTSLSCSYNQLTSLDVTKNTALRTLFCSYNKLTSIDVSKNTALRTLNCGYNKLTSLDISQNVALCTLYCYSNPLTSLDLSQNIALTYVDCYDNRLTSLDLSKNTALTYLACSGNLFTTAGFDSLMCSLPMKDTSDKARFLPLLNSTGTNATKFAASNSLNAKAKNWSVQYINGGAEIPATTGDYECPFMGNNNRYITLNVTKDSLISIRLATDAAGTPVRIVSGDSVYNITAGTSLIGTSSYKADGDTMTIYGDVNVLDMYSTGTAITGIDASHNAGLCTLWCNNSNLANLNLNGCTVLTYLNCDNSKLTTLDLSSCTALMYLKCFGSELTSLDMRPCTALRYLNCHSGKLTSLDVSNLTSLTEIICYSNEISSLNVSNCKALKKLDCGFNNLISLDVSDCDSLNELVCDSNKFTTGGFDSLMCSLPDRSGNTEGYFRPLRDANDGTYSAFMVSNSQNAQAKNWQVRYGNSGPTIPATTGNYDCDGAGEEDPEDTTNVTEIKLSNIALYPNPANSMLTIKNATANVQIFDITGREIMHVENKGEALLQINVSNLSKGMYFVKIGNYTTKFVKE